MILRNLPTRLHQDCGPGWQIPQNRSRQPVLRHNFGNQSDQVSYGLSEMLDTENVYTCALRQQLAAVQQSKSATQVSVDFRVGSYTWAFILILECARQVVS